MDWLHARKIGTAEAYLHKTFGKIYHYEIDRLLRLILKYHPMSGKYPYRSYSKDIGAYGHHRKRGIPPIKTLEEWANEPLTKNPGYGVQGIGFKL